MSDGASLSGRVALVTGADRGVGKGIALELARADCRVAVNYKDDPALAEATIAELRALCGNSRSSNAWTSTADITPGLRVV